MRNKKLKKVYEEGTTHDTTKEGMKFKKKIGKFVLWNMTKEK
jgi:hypothetical protein